MKHRRFIWLWVVLSIACVARGQTVVGGGSATTTASVTAPSGLDLNLAATSSSNAINLSLGGTKYVGVTSTLVSFLSVPVTVTSTTASFSTTTGALTVAGGIGCNGKISTKTVVVGGGAAMDFVSTSVLSLDFPSVSANGGTQDLTITVSGTALADSVIVNPIALTESGLTYMGVATATNTVVVRCTNSTTGAIDPASATFRITVISF